MFDKWSNRSIMAARDAANRNTRRRRSDELIRLRDENGRLRAELRAALTAPADGCEGWVSVKEDLPGQGEGVELCCVRPSGSIYRGYGVRGPTDEGWKWYDYLNPPQGLESDVLERDRVTHWARSRPLPTPQEGGNE